MFHAHLLIYNFVDLCKFSQEINMYFFNYVKIYMIQQNYCSSMSSNEKLHIPVLLHCFFFVNKAVIQN